MDEVQNDLSQKIDNLQDSISRFANLNTVQEKENSPSQPYQNSMSIHEMEAKEGEPSQKREVKEVITLRSGFWMIKIRRNCKEIERKSFGAKTEQKQGKNRGLRDFAAFAKLALRCETVSQPKRSRCGINMSLRKRPSFAKSFRNSFDSFVKIFAAAKPLLAHEFHFAAQEPPFRSCETVAKLQSMKIPNFAAKTPFRREFRSCETNFWHTSAISQHSDPHFATTKWLRRIKNCQFRSQRPISHGVLQLRNGCEA
ncbi:hypothetical protein CK203_108969 [Vitis vinifera]|uniref:Uncharacterized protein n=1 Tax=Vitis vinifera TaxID=29760 RepID=A0A438BQ35_VITVI|nr:hypothetical protein CK203_108969 [Vitis vinifera]